MEQEKKLRGFLNAGRNIGLGVAAIILVLILGLNASYTIGEQEQAVVTTFGSAQAVTTPGLHFKIPFIQSVHKVNTTIQGFSMGYESVDEFVEEDSFMITADYNFVNVDFYVEYRVSDPVKALYASEEPIAILKNISQSSIRTVIGNYDVDSVLTTGKNEIQAKIKEMIMAKLEIQDIGIQLVNIALQDSEPPTQEVMAAFKDVENAKQNMDTVLNNAQQYQSEQQLAASAQANQILQQAESQKTRRINEAKGEVAIFNATYAEYIKNPTVTRQRMFFETMEDVLPNLKVIIDGTNKADTLIIDDVSGKLDDKVTGSIANQGTEE